MKYIKEYKLFESIIPELFGDIINYDLIQDIKDAALEYIDEGYKLTYYVYIFADGGKYPIYLINGEFSHDIDKMTYMDNRRLIKKLETIKDNIDILRYDIGLESNEYMSYREVCQNGYETKLINLIASMYPDEEVGGVHNI